MTLFLESVGCGLGEWGIWIQFLPRTRDSLPTTSLAVWGTQPLVSWL